jgi:hypothetical protein
MATAGLGARLRSSPRLLALSKGLRGFVLGPPRPPKVTTPPPPRPAADFGVGLLRHVRPTSSPRSGYRLNLVVPTVDAARTYGGIRTALDLFEAVGADAEERRIISLNEIGPVVDHGVGAYVRVEPGEDPPAPLQLASLVGPEAPLAVRADDVFVASFWTTADVVAQVRRWQAAAYGAAPGRFAYLIQDFEPAFYPASTLSVLARATYANARETVAVFNTALLRDYLHDIGIAFGSEFTFEPRMLPVLRAAMTSPAVPRSRTIVIYGRPDTPRNAFAAIIDGLVAWRTRDSGAAEWRIVSVGQAHPEIDLGGGVVVRSLGKLEIADYAALLRESAIGLSLMVSPHPSYPPLEMAHLGMLVVSNRYGGKDLSTWHENIVSTEDLSADAIASLVSVLRERFEADRAIGDRGRALRPDFASDAPAFPFADRLAAELRAGAQPVRGATPLSAGRP